MTARFARLRDFINAWETSATVAEAAHRLGITERQASNTAAGLRRRRVPIKLMPGKWRVAKPRMSRDEWAELRRMVANFQAEREGDKYRKGA
jgi:predicted DNA-binding transcriptional regulator YafY